MPPAAQLLVVVVALVAFWVIVMRPARVQQRKVEQLQRELQVGDQVVLSAGIFGTVRSLEDARVQIEVAPGTVITAARQVVVRRVEDLPDAADHPSDHPSDRPSDRPTGTAGPTDPTQD